MPDFDGDIPDVLDEFYSSPVDDEVEYEFSKVLEPLWTQAVTVLGFTADERKALGTEIGDLGSHDQACEGEACRGCMTAAFTLHNRDFSEVRVVFNAPMMLRDKRLPVVVYHELIHALSMVRTKSADTAEQLESVVHTWAGRLAEDNAKRVC